MAGSIAMTLGIGGIGLWLAMSWLYPYLLRYLQYKEMYKPNYQGVMIPLAVGWLIPFSQLFAWPGAVYGGLFSHWLTQTTVIWGIAYAGWRDDQFGGLEAKGLGGHFALWWKEGRFTTGLWKVVIASFLAGLVSILFSNSLVELLLHFFLLILTTNLINLLDLRPGRALKGFFGLFLLLLSFTSLSLSVALWLPTVMACLFLIRGDLKARSMLGDTGSNSLGMVLGCWIVFFASNSLKWIILTIAILIHIYAEKRSLTILIQNTPVLHWVDMLGRTKDKKKTRINS
ncbi:hypothetical protein [Ammoniphilus sp. CFH 90114]|uniref:hypothetical protein n=1 Tax=Ammoniphilus sp. CFH 90114 TaxID=2493665 RepID=UPI00100F807B|nr:hypothetical protein [Ammoniphilus sp. CFH 90114]RXT13808.1 hypothetical protein EIZ39_06610 [Ammoniphilus sp. CFH 90114]